MPSYLLTCRAKIEGETKSDGGNGDVKRTVSYSYLVVGVLRRGKQNLQESFQISKENYILPLV